jgi:hypothetical protein
MPSVANFARNTFGSLAGFPEFLECDTAGTGAGSSWVLPDSRRSREQPRVAMPARPGAGGSDGTWCEWSQGQGAVWTANIRG